MNFNKTVAILMVLIVASMGLAGCVSNEDGDGGVSVSIVEVTSASNSDCPNGGVTILSGIDDNGDGILQDGEEDSAFHACDGADGQDGADGADGQDGNDGANGADGQDGADGANGTDGED